VSKHGKELLDRVAVITDFVANGSFASLKEHVKYKSTPGHAILVRTIDFNRGWDGKYVWVDQPAYEFLKKSRLVPGDVVISNVGTVGTTFRVPDLGQPMALGPNAVMLRTRDSQRLNQNYLYYWFYSKRGQAALRSITSGSAQQKFNKTSLRQLIIDSPNIKEQTGIANILGALDDKIELNRRMNATLEAMARALFHSWFVDFDPVHAKAEGRQPVGMDAETAALFPDSFEDSALGPIPKGWAHIDLSAVADVSSGKRPSAQYEYQTPSASVPIFGGAGQTGWTDTALIYEPVILTGRVGTLGRVLRTEGPIWPSDNTLVVQPKALWINQLYFALQNVDLVSLNRGSSQPMITQHDIRSQLIVAADSPVSLQFEALVAPLVELQTVLNANIERLADAQQALLPRLLSGELRAGDVAA
jgi:type I restriction enzyme S subunit